MKPYELAVAYEVFEFLQSLRQSDQRVLQGRLVLLREYPHNQSDFVERDANGRDYHINLRGKYAIKYWIDEAGREVKVLRIQLGDRAR
jgi:mRNA-degrading endonuclease RelE of RelBE toxin-antitoxin system